MGIIRQAFLSFLKNSSLYVMIMIEMTIILLGINVLVSGMENQKVLLRPYEGMLKSEGCAFSVDMRKYVTYDNVDEYYEQIDRTIDHLKGAKVFTFCTEFFTCQGRTIKAILYDDSMVPLKLPLQSGKWAKEKHTGVVSPDFAGMKNGQSITLDDTEIVITGTLTDPTYSPCLGDWKEYMDVSMFYKTYMAGDKEDVPFIILPLSSFSSEEDQLFLGKFHQERSLVLITFSDDCTDEWKKENVKALSELGYVTPLSEIYDNSIHNQEDIINNSRPLFFVGILISIIGFFSNKLIRLKSTENELCVYSLCGADKNIINKICLWQDVIMLSVSMLFATFFLMILKKYGAYLNLGLLVTGKNILWTFAVSSFYILMSFIINKVYIWRMSSDRT